MLDQTQQFQPEGFRSRIKVHHEPGNVSRGKLYNLFSAGSEAAKADQPQHSSFHGQKHFMASLQQAEHANHGLTSIDELSVNGNKAFFSRSKFSPPSDINNSCYLPTVNSRPIPFRAQFQTKGDKFAGSRFGRKYDGNEAFFPYKHVASTFPHENSRGETTKRESLATNFRKHSNLYVLNLSLDMTNDSLKAIMQEVGEVKHVCVLATLDNAGRRRAFVDMATPEEAYQVVESFHGKKIEGYELHVSYAFIQRSGGPSIPFDGITTTKPVEKRRITFPVQASGTKSSAARNLEEQDKNYTTKKHIHFAASRSENTTADVFNMAPNSLSQVAPSSQLNPAQDSPGTTPESDRESGSPATPLSGYEIAETSQESYVSFLSETYLNENMNLQKRFVPPKALECTLWVTNLSPVACIDSDDLFRFCVRQGFRNLTSASLNVDPQSGMSLGHGTLTFGSIEEYHQAFEAISSKDITLGGAKIKCAKFNPSLSITFCNHLSST